MGRVSFPIATLAMAGTLAGCGGGGGEGGGTLGGAAATGAISLVGEVGVEPTRCSRSTGS